MLRRFTHLLGRENSAALRTSPNARCKSCNAVVEMEERLTIADSKAAFLAAISAVQPFQLIQNTVQLRGSVLTVKGRETILKRPCHVVGFGKAVFEMALSLERILGESMKLGVVSVPVGTTQKYPKPANSRIKVLEGALNNLPDKMAERNAEEILGIVESLKEEDTVLVLISGGGSALLPLPLPPLQLEEKLQVIKQLAHAGADILQLNCVRKQLSRVKGGRLAKAAHPATVISLILSDVIGDPIDFIASGPTAPNNDSVMAAWDIVCNFNLQNSIPKSAQLCLTAGNIALEKLQGSQVQNILIGNNMVAIEAAVEKMQSLNYKTCVLSKNIEGNVAEVASFYSELAFRICQSLATGNCTLLQEFDVGRLSPGLMKELTNIVQENTDMKGIVLIAGGETTVKVTGKGIGGRNQELALRFAALSRKIAIESKQMDGFEVTLMSAGTDGIDGPTNAAGAFGYAGQLSMEDRHIKSLEENDSHTFYSELNGGKDLIVTGHTGTNVMDIHILAIVRKRQ